MKPHGSKCGAVTRLEIPRKQSDRMGNQSVWASAASIISFGFIKKNHLPAAEQQTQT